MRVSRKERNERKTKMKTEMMVVMAMVVPWRGVKMLVLAELHTQVKSLRSVLVQYWYIPLV